MPCSSSGENLCYLIHKLKRACLAFGIDEPVGVNEFNEDQAAIYLCTLCSSLSESSLLESGLIDWYSSHKEIDDLRKSWEGSSKNWLRAAVLESIQKTKEQK